MKTLIYVVHNFKLNLLWNFIKKKYPWERDKEIWKSGLKFTWLYDYPTTAAMTVNFDMLELSYQFKTLHDDTCTT